MTLKQLRTEYGKPYQTEDCTPDIYYADWLEEKVIAQHEKIDFMRLVIKELKR